jgi:hypothetical protein
MPIALLTRHIARVQFAICMQPPAPVIKSGTDAQARARLLAHFIDHPRRVFYNRQLEVLFENEYFHWVTNRALRDLVLEGKIATEDRILSHGASIKLLWNKGYRFYKRDADEVVALIVDPGPSRQLVLAGPMLRLRLKPMSGSAMPRTGEQISLRQP